MKQITISEYVASFTRVPESVTSSEYINGNRTPLEPARIGRETTVGVKLPGDQAEVVDNKYLNNPQAAVRVLRTSIDPEDLRKARQAVIGLSKSSRDMAIMPSEGILRAAPSGSVKPSNIKPVWEKTGDELFPSRFKK